MAKNLFQIAKQKKIKYFLISFVDLFGVLRSKLVPAHAIKDMQKTGAGFAGFAAWLDMTPADADMFGVPDPNSLIQLPWNKEVGWLASDLWMNGKPVDASPRVMLKNQIKKLAKQGLTMKSGVECEYFLISPDGSSIADPRDTQSKPCYDQSALMRRYDLIKEICDCMIEMGWGPYQNDHEDANGQFEMNWDYADCLVTADRHAFFKFMVKTIAEKHGLRATFMPKPFENLTGNGCHAHISVWDGKKNKFLDKCKKSKVDGLIVVDLPYPENKSFASRCKKNGVNFIQLVSPTTSQIRLKKIIKDSHDMVYYISMLSTTGGKLKVSPKKILERYNKIKNQNKSKNVVIGFGITEKTIKSLKKADGLVVGSAICKEISKSIERRQNTVTNVTNIVKRLRNKIQ